jgi:hypothetical protein
VWTRERDDERLRHVNLHPLFRTGERAGSSQVFDVSGNGNGIRGRKSFAEGKGKMNKLVAMMLVLEELGHVKREEDR